MKIPFQHFTFRRAATLLFAVIVAFAPSGTRYIFRTGEIAGNAVEPGTVSVFMMQLAALGFVACAFVAAGWRRIVDLMRFPHVLAALFLAGLGLLSSFVAVDPLSGFLSGFSLLLAVAVFVGILLVRPDPHESLTAFVGGALFQVGIGAWQFFTQNAFASKWLGMAMHSADQLGAFVIETDTGRWLRAYGSLSHPNVFGLYVGIGFLTCVGLAAFRGHGRHLRFYAVMPLIVAGLLFSFSRSAVLAVAAGFLWMVISAYGSEAAPAFRRVLMPSFIIGAMTFGLLGYFFTEPLITRVTAEGRLEQRSFSERDLLVADATALLVRHPLTGVGIGQMPLAVLREIETDRPWWQYQYVHVVPLLAAVETGIGGFFAWLAFVGYTFAVIWQRLSKRTEASSGVTVYAAAFLAMVIASLFDHFLWSSWFGQLLFWTVAGLLHAAYAGIDRARVR